MGISRRRVIAGGAAVAGVAGAGLVMRGLPRDDPRPSGPGGSPDGSPSPGTPSPIPPTVSPTPLPRGGRITRTSPVSMPFDTFDALRAGEPSVAIVLGLTHSRLLRWAEVPHDRSIGALAGDLARSWEQPSETTLLLHLDPAARWQDSALLAGRPVTTQDIAAHLQRRMALAGEHSLPGVQRGWAMASFERAEAVDARTVRVTLREPDPFALETLAARFAFVQAPGLVEELGGRWMPVVEHAPGSGPWVATVVDPLRVVFEARREGHRQPALDGIEILGPVSRPAPADINGRAEWVIRDPRDRDLFAAGQWRTVTAMEDAPVLSTVHAGSAPWRDERLVRALSLALNRQWMVQALFAGSAVPSSSVPPVHGGFAPTQEQLSALPGHSESSAGAAARQAWEAAGVVGPLVIDFPSVFDPRYSASSIISGRLREVLGIEVRPAIDNYANISKKAAEGYYGNGRLATWFGWGPPFAEPDPGPWLRETFHSSSATARLAGLTSGGIDRELDALPVTPRDRRPAVYANIASILANGTSGGVLHWVTETHSRYLRLPVGSVDTSPWSAWTDATSAFLG